MRGKRGRGGRGKGFWEMFAVVVGGEDCCCGGGLLLGGAGLLLLWERIAKRTEGGSCGKGGL